MPPKRSYKNFSNKKKRELKNVPSSVFTFNDKLLNKQPDLFSTTSINNDSVENNNDVEITTKIYPTSYRNRKGFQIGNMKIKFDTKNAPFTSNDQVDHYLNELFSYIKWTTTKKHPDDETVEDMKKSIHDFLKAKKIDHVFSPKVIIGKGKKQTRKIREKKNKLTNNNKSRKENLVK